MSKSLSNSVISVDRPVLRAGWVWATLGDICRLEAGDPAPQGAEHFQPGGHPFVRVQDLGRLGSQVWIHETKDAVTDSAARRLKVFPKGAVLFTKSGMSTLLNQRAILARDMSVVSHIGVAVPYSPIPSAYVYYWLRTVDLGAMAHATTLPSLPLSKVRGAPIPLAPLQEQLRLVAAIEEQFSQIDAGVTALHRARRSLKRMRAAVVQAAVTGRLVPQDANDEPATLLLRRLLEQRQVGWSIDGHHGHYPQPDEREGVVGDLPSGWAWTKVDQLVVRIDYGTSARCSAELKDGVPVLRMGNIQDGELDFSNLKYLPEYHPEIENLLLRDGDILFNRTNSPELVGKSAVFRNFSRPVIFASYLIRLRLSPLVDPRWISLFINGPVGRSYVAAVRVQQVGQANVNGTKLAAMPIALPPIAEQRRILDEADRQLAAVKALDLLASRAEQHGRRLKQGILAYGFKGRLVPQDPSEEPATILLDRIRAGRAASGSLSHQARRELHR